ncbi:hypothetical protein, partial [Acinetobacter baumannii]|uniref:hypothetical protein n=1 Tax=Acinetobacter baumannii TaxID=470 RepID=UPI003AF67E98
MDNIIESDSIVPTLVLPEIVMGLKFECKAANSKARIIGLAISIEQAYCKIEYNIICDVAASVSYKWFTYQEILDGFK